MQECNLADGHHYGLVCSKKGEVERFVKNDNTVIQLQRDSAEAYNNRGVSYQQKGERLYAIQDYSTAIGLNPQLADAYNNRGSLYLREGDIYRAVDDCTQALKLNPDLGVAYGNCGIAFLHLGYWKRAKADLRVAEILRVNVSKLFHHYYDSVVHFERKTEMALPTDIVAMLDPQRVLPEFEEGTRLKLALRAYENRELSTGLSARFAGVSREAFMSIMSQHGLSPFGTVEDLRADLAYAKKAGYQ